MTEKLSNFIPLVEARQELPGRGRGKAVSRRTMWRWCRQGIKGARLRSRLIGGTRCTTLGWINEFLDLINGPGEPRLRKATLPGCHPGDGGPRSAPSHS